MQEQHIKVNTIIIGGGIAGLWLLNRLNNEGRSAILLENRELGHGQTINSQGMIHGGIKYALSGALTGSSQAIANMPERWRRCLRGEGDVNLQNCKTLSEHFYMWSPGGIGSRVTSFFASKATRGRVEKLKQPQHPPPFDNKTFKGAVYRLVDLVLDVPSLLNTLRQNQADKIFSIDWKHSQIEQDETGKVSALITEHQGQRYRIETQWLILSAGEGNAQLMEKLGIKQPRMQIRPLHQLIVKHNYPYPLYAHCMGTNPSPRLTISSHPCKDGSWVWYLGGDLATEGVKQSTEELITKGKRELTTLFPWLDFSKAQWRSLKVNRAEPQQQTLIKPDEAFAQTAEGAANIIVAWPTKLTLAPALSDDIVDLLATLPQHSPETEKNTHPDNLQALNKLPTPDVSQACWETLFD